MQDTPMVHNERTKGKKQKLGFPIEDFGNDGEGVDSRQKISGMTEGVDSRLNFGNDKNGKPLRGEGDKVLAHFAEYYNICSDLIFFLSDSGSSRYQ